MSRHSRAVHLKPEHALVHTPSRDSRLPELNFDDRSLCFLKWVALLLMVVDHANMYLLGMSQVWMYELGRICMPLFVFVLGYNLGRPGALHSGAYRRTAKRLLVFGILATPPFAVVSHLHWGWYPLNMLFGLLVGVLAAWGLDRGGRWPTICACLVLAWGGALVEFWWPAVGAFMAVWAYRRRPSWSALVGFVLCLAVLYVFPNGNFWALAAIPVIALARLWRWRLPRAQGFFYWFFPAHFWALWVYVEWFA